jgi:hypothetical protein
MSIRVASSSTVVTATAPASAIPVGTVEERPKNPGHGDLYFNTTHDTLEQYTKGGWQKMGYQIAMALKMNKMELM